MYQLLKLCLVVYVQMWKPPFNKYIVYMTEFKVFLKLQEEVKKFLIVRTEIPKDAETHNYLLMKIKRG